MASSKSLERLVFASLFLVVAVVMVMYWMQDKQARRNQVQRNEIPIYSVIQPFVLTNQTGQAFEFPRDLSGNWWLANIIFTRCPGPCAAMTRQMRQIQKHLPAGRSLEFISLTTDPEFDHPNVLQRYGTRFDADYSNWNFLTGERSVLTDLAVRDLKLVVVEKPESEQEFENDLFIHSTKFILVDPKGQVRGIFDGASYEVEAEDESGENFEVSDDWILSDFIPKVLDIMDLVGESSR